MHLPTVEEHQGHGKYAEDVARLRNMGVAPPQIFHLFAFKPDRTDALSKFTHGVMRGSSPLSAGMRELIAAFTSRRNQCLF